MTDAHEDRMPWLGPLLTERDASGQRRYSLTQAEDFLAGLLLSQGIRDPDALPPALLDLLTRFSARAQVPQDADHEAANHAVAAYFAAHPVPESLKRDFGARYRAMLTDLDPEALAQASLQLSGEQALAKTKAPPAPGPKGALAFFMAKKRN